MLYSLSHTDSLIIVGKQESPLTKYVFIMGNVMSGLGRIMGKELMPTLLDLLGKVPLYGS
jgi:hypothetical protein